NTAEATLEVALINAGTTTVSAYATQLLNANLAFSEVALAVDSLVQGGTPTAGALLTPTSTKNELQNLAVGFLPSQAANAIKNGLNVIAYDAETAAVGIAAGDGTQNNFLTNFGSLTAAQAATTISGATGGVNGSVILQWITNWQNFYNGAGKAAVLPGLTATTQSYAAAFGD